MSRRTLRLHTPPPLPLDLRALGWAQLASRADDELSRQPVWQGRTRAQLGEFFTVTTQAADGPAAVVVEGDAGRIDALGCAWREGELRITGAAGDYLGAGMTGGRIVCEGRAGALAGCEMAGGRLEVHGDVGDFAAGALPGSMDGMRGGELVVRGSAGQRLADRMRRGMVWVHGDAGDFAASRMVAGNLAIGGRVGEHLAWGMRRGTVLLCSASPVLADTFVATRHDFAAAWALMARAFAAEGGPFAGTDAGSWPLRWVGDRSVDGRGEVLMPG